MTHTGKPKSVKDAREIIQAAYIASEIRASKLEGGIDNPQTRELYDAEMVRYDTLVSVAQMLSGMRAEFNMLLAF